MPVVDPTRYSPVHEVVEAFFSDREVRVWIKRDDLIHPIFGGNKWRKLRYNIHEMRQAGQTQLITFAGPFSNYLYAVAGICHDSKIDSTVYVRGTVNDANNPVLTMARQCGVKLAALSRDDFAGRSNPAFLARLQKAHPGARIIPEGGSNVAALRGCEEIVHEVYQQLDATPDFWFVPAGTGATAMGMSRVISQQEQLIAVLAVKTALAEMSVHPLLGDAGTFDAFESRFHFGGLAKWTPQLIQTIQEFEALHGILLDPLYTGKSWYALRKMVASGEIPPGSHVVFVHTGGMAGRRAFNYRYGQILSDPS